MTSQARWIASVIDQANACTTKLPWERGAPRTAMITRRLEAEQSTDSTANG